MDTRPRTSLISFCTVQLRTLCAAHSLATLCLFMTSGPDPGELPGFWGSMVFRYAPIPRKGSGKQQQEKQKMDANTRLHRKMTVNESKTTHSFYCFSGRATTTNIPFQTPTVVCHHVCVPMFLVSFLHSFDVLMEAFSFALCSLFPDLRESSNSD